jgi:hypothetical protein
MAAERIEFSLVVHAKEDTFPRPYPANRDVPEWFKAMPTETQVQGTDAPGADAPGMDGPGMTTGTVKNCPPFIEAITCGYIIPLAADISLSLDSAGVFHGAGRTGFDPAISRYADIVQIHKAAQVKGAPFENCPVVKILNPWLIRTPPGCSALFLPPLNRFQMPLYPLAGLVETDIFYREVNFPAVLMIPPGTTLTLRKGTPFVQVIPIKRDEYQSEFVPLDVETYRTSRPSTLPENHNLFPETQNYYRNNFWRKKNYR